MVLSEHPDLGRLAFMLTQGYQQDWVVLTAAGATLTRWLSGHDCQNRYDSRDKVVESSALEKGRVFTPIRL